MQMVASCSSFMGFRQRCLHNSKRACHARPVMVRAATPNAAPSGDPSGKAPDGAKPPSQQAAPADSRQTSSPSSSSAAPDKRKGSWTPPYPSLANTKPLPQEDVRTNIDM
ncbi:hypothetical protein PLESTF_000314600 [Pleodorina starrii]|nr:hypothetical protein PLESTM_000684300 [Pleodorina starrii]GLC65575.1 hypothetical protein PLESTF_000314600 [Pleodorina starrii]